MVPHQNVGQIDFQAFKKAPKQINNFTDKKSLTSMIKHIAQFDIIWILNDKDGAKHIFNDIRGANKSKYTDGIRSLSTLVTKTHDFWEIYWN